MNLLPGAPYPLGASWDGRGVNFALYSENASRVELCLFGPGEVETRVTLETGTSTVVVERSRIVRIGGVTAQGTAGA